MGLKLTGTPRARTRNPLTHTLKIPGGILGHTHTTHPWLLPIPHPHSLVSLAQDKICACFRFKDGTGATSSQQQRLGRTAPTNSSRLNGSPRAHQSTSMGLKLTGTPRARTRNPLTHTLKIPGGILGHTHTTHPWLLPIPHPHSLVSLAQDKICACFRFKDGTGATSSQQQRLGRTAPTNSSRLVRRRWPVTEWKPQQTSGHRRAHQAALQGSPGHPRAPQSTPGSTPGHPRAPQGTSGNPRVPWNEDILTRL